ncbi:hypothetical protein BJY01DRAFT_83150 [Aspergillus pseudoustus]|uniref:BZIP domain-containing protein n=1 Tax=Aspergillus pseudoustus TaxID=1810923 RepID=A0ABR4KKY1_9EURO
MDDTRSSSSIRIRQRAVLGTFSFVPPVVGDAPVSPPDQRPKRRQQVLQAQRNHRKRTKDYMVALEEEVARLRAEKESLAETAANWQRCVSALVKPALGSSGHSDEMFNLEPGFFLWSTSRAFLTDSTPLNNDFKWELLRLPMPTQIYPSLNPSPLTSYTSLEHALLHNFCQRVVPSLEVTGVAPNGYIKHIVPLALSNKMVMGSLLAASSSHIQIRHVGRPTVCGLKYRLSAILELRKASERSQADVTSSETVFALTTILGLLIEDMISGIKEFSVLLKLVDFWMRTSACTDPDASATRCFLIEQINLLKRLVYPVYQFESRQAKATRCLLTSNDPKIMCRIFSLIQSAVVRACTLYNFLSIDTEQTSATSEINLILDDIKSTASRVPEYSLGENSLVWVYQIAISKSTQPDHQAFFTSRLAELLRRIGYDDIPEALSGAKVNL